MVSGWCRKKVKEGNSFMFQFDTTDKDKPEKRTENTTA